MKYLKHFETETQYNVFKTSEEFITPNVTYIKDDNKMYYHSLVRNNVITYQANSKLPEVSDKYDIGLHVNAFNSSMVSHEFDNGIGTITFEEDVTYIIRGFSGCSGLTSINIPNSVTYIGDDAFRECSGLTSINIPNSVTEIGEWAFSGCKGLTSINIPNSVTYIGKSAFYYCSGLTSITIPNSVTYIGNSAFYHCSRLTGDLVIPDGVTKIGNDAFGFCDGLTSINIPDSVKTIGDYAFENCTGLTGELVIPYGVTSIGDQAFLNCSGLTSITCYAPTAPSIQSDTFYGIKPNGTLYVPAGSDYSSWMSTGKYYLGYYGWSIEEI